MLAQIICDCSCVPDHESCGRILSGLLTGGCCRSSATTQSPRQGRSMGMDCPEGRLDLSPRSLRCRPPSQCPTRTWKQNAAVDVAVQPGCLYRSSFLASRGLSLTACKGVEAHLAFSSPSTPHLLAGSCAEVHSMTKAPLAAGEADPALFHPGIFPRCV